MAPMKCANGKHYIIIPFGGHLVKDCDCIMKIKPNPNCTTCHGVGEVYDSVPYGSTTAQLVSFCGCVESQIPEDYDGDIELDYGITSDEFANLNDAVSELFTPVVRFIERLLNR
jgi:hypothetical protein